MGQGTEKNKAFWEGGPTGQGDLAATYGFVPGWAPGPGCCFSGEVHML